MMTPPKLYGMNILDLLEMSKKGKKASQSTKFYSTMEDYFFCIRGYYPTSNYLKCVK